MNYTKENLHDKWVTSNWHQLWANDDKAFIFMPLNDSPDEMLVIEDDGEFAQGVVLPWSDGMDEWNRQINVYLAETRGL